MHVCLRFVVRMYQAQLVFLMFERDSQSQFTLYSSVSVLNKLISLALNLTRVTRPYQVVTTLENFTCLINGDFLMILTDGQKWSLPTKTLLTTLFENAMKKVIMYGRDVYRYFNERELLLIVIFMDPNEVSKYIKQIRCL